MSDDVKTNAGEATTDWAERAKELAEQARIAAEKANDAVLLKAQEIKDKSLEALTPQEWEVKSNVLEEQAKAAQTNASRWTEKASTLAEQAKEAAANAKDEVLAKAQALIEKGGEMTTAAEWAEKAKTLTAQAEEAAAKAAELAQTTVGQAVEKTQGVAEKATEAATQLSGTVLGSEAATAIAATGAAASVSPFVFQFAIFVMAIFVGYYVVWSVTPALHTPLMSVTNAISSVIIVGAILAVGLQAAGGAATTFGFIALILAAVNIFGGFMVTSRMLAMYKKKER